MATGNNQTPGGSQKSDSYEGSFLLPYGPLILPNTLDKIPTGDTKPQDNSKNPFNNNSRPSNNGTGGPPGNNTPLGNMTRPNGTALSAPPGNMTAPGNTIPGDNGQGLSMSSLNISGTTIYSGKYFKIVKYSL